ncbi:hypothetical protein CDD81_4475 [Ophiocordyceps australis]|uniref:Uncharacterized protein n=1 Tax=Ophiocordyceps australis TaxID=1399860 RepID=A0A2C5YHX1_9HYPO|nr:hypothetical protein CDD81_4475 [Ophiocordyceps australis]
MAGSSNKWTWSKSTRIKVMLVIDTAFFLLELISGLLAHSLALTADAFHMLNDIISLVIGLWAVVAAQKETTDAFTFGWVRAEILGAFFNAVFLIALCVSILLEALTRFIEPPEINNPRLILIVGCAGLVSNLLGFVVLGGHGHSHGNDDDHAGHDHGGHSHSNQEADLEQGRPSRPQAGHTAGTSDAANDVSTEGSEATRRIRFQGDAAQQDASAAKGSRSSGKGRRRRQSSKSGHSRFASIEDMSIHPASFRQDIIAASLAASSNTPGQASDTSDDSAVAESDAEAGENSPLLKGSKGPSHGATDSKSRGPCSGFISKKRRSRRDSSVHDGHHHTLPRQPGSKASGHSHADMGMNAMVLHVIGDALGNVGVIITGLIIWLTNWPGKIYADPAVSLIITAIILKTSVPLTLATARVLLQATPDHISIREIRQDIERLPGVVSCHHIHVWQLSDTKVVASLHLQVSFPINSHSGEKYMQLAKRARKCLHGYGIHSATIQPEFCLDKNHRHDQDTAALALDGPATNIGDNACLLACIDDCKAPACCPGQDASSKASSTRRGSESSLEGGSHAGHRHS